MVSRKTVLEIMYLWIPATPKPLSFQPVPGDSIIPLLK